MEEVLNLLTMDSESITAPTCAVTTMAIMQQPAPEVTKNQYFIFSVVVKNCSCEDHPCPVATLVYDGDGEIVPPGSGHEVLEGRTSWDGVKFVFRVRINELSRNHRNRLFCIRLTHHGAWCVTRAIKVLSKSSIVKAHSEGITSSKQSKRARDQEPTGSNCAGCNHFTHQMSELKRLCLDSQHKATTLTDSVQRSVAQLRADLSTMAASVTALTEYVHAIAPIVQNSPTLELQQPFAKDRDISNGWSLSNDLLQDMSLEDMNLGFTHIA